MKIGYGNAAKGSSNNSLIEFYAIIIINPELFMTSYGQAMDVMNNSGLDIYDFILPFGGHLKEDNRWVVLRGMIDWDMIDEKYGQNFENKDAGQEALSAQVAFGSLYIQRRLGFTDRELVEQIAENPYMQFFIGYKEYRNEKPFDPSLLVTFRKRLPEETMNRIIEKLFIQKAAPNDKHDDKEDPDGDYNPGGDGSGGGDSPNNTQKADELPNRGTLILDATCTPADIAFPTDLELCDKARRWTEIILDHCWALYGSINGERSPGHTAK